MKKMIIIFLLLVCSLFSIWSVKAQAAENSFSLGLSLDSDRAVGQTLRGTGKEKDLTYSFYYKYWGKTGITVKNRNIFWQGKTELKWIRPDGRQERINLSRERSSEKDVPGSLFPQWSEIRDLTVDSLEFSSKKGKETFRLYWQRDDRERETSWWPAEDLRRSNLKFAQSSLNNYLLSGDWTEEKQLDKASLIRTKIFLAKEWTDYSIVEKDGGQLLESLPTRQLYRGYLGLEGQRKFSAHNSLVWSSKLDYHSLYSPSLQGEAKYSWSLAPATQLTFRTGLRTIFPNARQLWGTNLRSGSSVYLFSDQLLPERRQELELSLKQSLDQKDSWLSLRFYDYKIKDYIAYKRTDYPAVVIRQYSNFPQVEWQGVELGLKKYLVDNVYFNWMHNHQSFRDTNTGKIIAYRPFDAGKWELIYHNQDSFRLVIGSKYEGKRYSDDKNKFFLKPYDLSYLHLSGQIAIDTKLSLRVDNFLGRKVDDGNKVWKEPFYTLEIEKRF